MKNKNNIIAFIWGFAEATFFFIVPDVALTYFALDKNNKAFIACLYAVSGAVIGGITMYYLGIHYYLNMIKFLDFIPAISPDMINGVKQNLEISPILSIFTGAFKGIPYKIYAVQSTQVEISFVLFLIVSFFARITRFLFSVIITSFVSNIILRNSPQKTKIIVHLVFWTLLYTIYFIIMPNN